MMWAPRILIGSFRISFSKITQQRRTLYSPVVCAGCMQRLFSDQSFGLLRNVHRMKSSNHFDIYKRMLASTGGKVPDDVPIDDSSKTSVKVQSGLKSRPTKKKTDFNKEYRDNIYIECDRARYEYLLSEKQLKQLPVIMRRSPYPGSDNISVYHKKHIMNKVNEVWGSMENLRKEKQHRRQWENLDSFLMREEHYQPTIVRVTAQKPKETIFNSGPGKVVLWSFTVNATNVLMKFIAWLYTGSHSMFSEFIHSMADTVNQMILAVGVHQSLKQPDLEHPYGWANFRNVASLISGVGIFCLGAGFSIYHGIMGLLHPHTMESLYWGIAILGGSFLSEGGMLLVAINEVRNSAKRENMTFMNYVWLGRDPSTNVVLLEDAAAVLGVTIAATCMSITHYTGNPLADAMGSILIGTLLGGVASFIIHTNTTSLIGRSIPSDQKAKLMSELENDRMIRAIHDVKATEMGGNSVRFKAEVDFDGKEVTRYYLETSDVDALLVELKSVQTTDELEVFMLKHGENIIDMLGAEVDRIEKNLKKHHPEVRHVDLEQL